jgi:hypothetical protein
VSIGAGRGAACVKMRHTSPADSEALACRTKDTPHTCLDAKVYTVGESLQPYHYLLSFPHSVSTAATRATMMCLLVGCSGLPP